MNAPFYNYGLFNDHVSLMIAVLIGAACGFVLERAGFGSARKLAAQFYFTDMSVLKVMFTAIVTAMIGVYGLSAIGFLNLKLVAIPPTYVMPQVVGGLVLGVGFVVGGYCPGTSCVAAVTGRYDGWLYMIGLFTGVLIFDEAFVFLENFYDSTSMGGLTLPRWLNVPYGIVVVSVICIALGAFVAAEWGERKMAGDKSESEHEAA